LSENDRNFDLPRMDGEDIFDYLDRFAAKLKLVDYGPDNRLLRDMLVAITTGDYAESNRISELLERKKAAQIKVIK